MHPWAWGFWLAAALVGLSVTRNPLYLALILLCIAFVALAWQGGQTIRLPGGKRPIPPFKLAVFMIGLAALFNALTSHIGETRLFTIPGRLPLLSGAVTLEALVYGVINGLVLAGMFASFAVLSQVLPVQALVRMIPRAYYPVAVVTSIAVTYVPTTLRQFQQVREAQAVRGHRLRGLRDWLPLLVPLLVGGLEHALQLAEAMTARGFASQPSPESSAQPRPAQMWRRLVQPRLALLLGPLLLVGGWLLRLAGYSGLAGVALMLLGAGLVTGGLWKMGRSVPRTNYRSWRWHSQDTLVLLGALLVLAAFLMPGPVSLPDTRWYNPYPALALPAFDAWLGLAILGLLAPGLGRAREL
jgi:energy-coupling factor transport system permease protein